MPPGDPRRGGRPPVSRLYQRHLQPPQIEAFQDAPIGDLDNEIRLAKANLDEVVRRQQTNPGGGLVLSVTNTDGSKTVRFRPWFEIELEHLDKIRRLEETRAALLDQEDLAEVPNEDPALAVVEGVMSGRIRGPHTLERLRAAIFLREDTVGKPIQRMKVTATLSLGEIVAAAQARRTDSA